MLKNLSKNQLNTITGGLYCCIYSNKKLFSVYINKLSDCLNVACRKSRELKDPYITYHAVDNEPDCKKETK